MQPQSLTHDIEKRFYHERVIHNPETSKMPDIGINLFLAELVGSSLLVLPSVLYLSSLIFSVTVFYSGRYDVSEQQLASYLDSVRFPMNQIYVFYSRTSPLTTIMGAKERYRFQVVNLFVACVFMLPFFALHMLFLVNGIRGGDITSVVSSAFQISFIIVGLHYCWEIRIKLRSG